jgi:hypothetical protein
MTKRDHGLDQPIEAEGRFLTSTSVGERAAVAEIRGGG